MKILFGLGTLALVVASAGAQQYGQPTQQQQDAYRQQQQQDQYRQQQQPGYPQQQQGYPQQQGYQQGQRWDVPPSDFNDVGRRAFHDGMDAAHNDWQSHRPLDPRRSMMFRRPPTDRMNRDQYRSSFARGYQVAVEHRDRWMDHDHDHWNDRDRDHDHDPR